LKSELTYGGEFRPLPLFRACIFPKLPESFQPSMILAVYAKSDATSLFLFD